MTGTCGKDPETLVHNDSEILKVCLHLFMSSSFFNCGHQLKAPQFMFIWAALSWRNKTNISIGANKSRDFQDFSCNVKQKNKEGSGGYPTNNNSTLLPQLMFWFITIGKLLNEAAFPISGWFPLEFHANCVLPIWFAFASCELISLIFKIELFFAASAQVSSDERAVVTFYIYYIYLYIFSFLLLSL